MSKFIHIRMLRDPERRNNMHHISSSTHWRSRRCLLVRCLLPFSQAVTCLIGLVLKSFWLLLAVDVEEPRSTCNLSVIGFHTPFEYPSVPLTGISLPIKVILWIAVTLQVQSGLLSSWAMSEWYMVVGDVVEEMNLLLG